MRRIRSLLLLPLLACSSVPPSDLDAAAQGVLQRSVQKEADDERLASLTAGRLGLRPVVLASVDGLPIPGYLFEPLEVHPRPRPAVLFLHGGEHGTFSSRSLPRVEALVNMGLAVLALDYRGSSGYSSAFHDAADYGGMEIDDVLAARDWIVDQGIAREGSIALLGSSHGGYNALMAAARRPGGFAACVDFYGPTDLVYRVTSTPEENPNAAPGDGAKFARMVGATVEEDPDAYRARSPRFLAAQIDAALLIVHGTQDGVVHIRESEWLVAALEEAGRSNFEFLRVAGGQHGYPAEAYAPAWEQVLLFLEQHLNSD